MRYYSGSALRDVRELRGMSRELLAVKIDRTASAIHKYEANRVVPSGPVLGRLADALGVDVDAFFPRGGTVDAA
jgi:transcriptional regulator with XRE-family HTH domain